MSPTFEYDPAKSLNTYAKRGIDFEEAQGVWWDPDYLRTPATCVEGEGRWAYTGEVEGRLVTVIVAELTSDALRIIAVYDSGKALREAYKARKGKL